MLETMLSRANANNQQVAIFCFKGIDKFKSGMIKTLSLEPEWSLVTSVTVVADADGSPTGRSNQICGRI